MGNQSNFTAGVSVASSLEPMELSFFRSAAAAERSEYKRVDNIVINSHYLVFLVMHSYLFIYVCHYFN